jgi:hypothetical protein
VSAPGPGREASRKLDSSIEAAVSDCLVRIGRRVLADCDGEFRLSLTRIEWFAVLSHGLHEQSEQAR